MSRKVFETGKKPFQQTYFYYFSRLLYLMGAEHLFTIYLSGGQICRAFFFSDFPNRLS